jgi:predicted ester cyclase
MSATCIETLGLARPVVEFVRAVNASDLGAAVAQLAPDAVHRTSSASYPPQAVRAMLGRLRAVFPDLSIEIRDQRLAGNIVVSQLVATGTHRGSFLGRPASGERVSWESVDVAEVGPLDVGRPTAAGASRYRVLARRWSLWNAPELFGRLGSVPG